ncbi:MAG: hypothetical protein U0531_15515 [Dehalococcoidia bacterium]
MRRVRRAAAGELDRRNSPAEFDGLDLSGRRAIIAASNGTRAL